MQHIERFGQSQNVHTLRHVVEVNARIRRVIDVARDVRYSAVNASLMARRAGARTMGFSVVASELRRFSQELEDIMLALGAQLSALVKVAAALQKKEREHGLLVSAKKSMRSRAESMDCAIGKARDVLRDLRQHLRESWRRLGTHVRHALRICSTGVALSSSGKIEAVHGLDLRDALAQVAGSIGATVTAVFETLRDLSRTIIERQRGALA